LQTLNAVGGQTILRIEMVYLELTAGREAAAINDKKANNWNKTHHAEAVAQM